MQILCEENKTIRKQMSSSTYGEILEFFQETEKTQCLDLFQWLYHYAVTTFRVVQRGSPWMYITKSS